MKKWVLITGIIILIIAGVLVVHRVKNNMPKVLPNGTVVYNFTKQRQHKASKILYEYILEEYAEDSKRYHDIDYIKTHYGNIKKYAETEFLITPKRVHAFEYDLNDDGKNEIIGFPAVGFFNCAQGFSFYILQKKYNKYYNILDKNYMFHVEPILNLYILKNKTNGYNDILYYGSYLYDFPSNIIKYGTNGYIYSKFLK